MSVELLSVMANGPLLAWLYRSNTRRMRSL
jgi:hypothetical protein